MELDEWILAGICGTAGLVSGAAAGWILPRLPVSWLLDYEATADPAARAETAPAAALPVWAIPAHVILLGVGGALMPGIWMFLVLWLLSLLSLADLACRILPDQLILALFGLGLLSLFSLQPLQVSVTGALLGGGTLLALGVLGGSLQRQEVLGAGDVKLMAALGFCMGARGILPVLSLTLLFLGIVGAVLLVLGRIRTEDGLPLAPFALVAAFLALLFPDLPSLPLPDFLL